MAEALLIVDFQNDFTPPAGALAVPGGEAIAGRVNELAAGGRFDLVVATRDWHPRDHGSFTEQGGIWPVHCVQGTDGAEYHPALEQERIDVEILKGQPVDTDGYSGFDGTELARVLREHDVDRVTVVGLATDYCVRWTARHALEEGFEVTVDTSAVRAVDREPGDGDRALEEVAAAGGTVA